MSIVCLGWGSLIWDPRNLPVVDAWRTDGPLLPVEFARESKDGRITLVIVPGLLPCQTLWAEIRAEKISDAIQELSNREGANKSAIGHWPNESRAFPCQDVISSWALKKKFAAVVWTALQPGFVDSRGAVPSVEALVAHLDQLPGASRDRASEYVRRTPAQIATPYRRALEAALRIEPGGAAQGVV